MVWLDGLGLMVLFSVIECMYHETYVDRSVHRGTGSCCVCPRKGVLTPN